MSYELADGSWSTDYKIGDEFEHVEQGIVVLYRDEGRKFAFFTRLMDGAERVCYWGRVTPIKAKTTNQLRETIKQLEATIQELER